MSVANQSRAAIEQGSKSFALASLIFAPEMRGNAHRLYAWCRHCDDVIDGQTLGHGATANPDAAAALARLRQDTDRAFAGASGLPLPFQALQEVAEATSLPKRYALQHLDGFQMDVDGRAFETIEDVLAYCYGVAGVVGVMMAHLMGVRDDATLDRASDLGLAFQLTNIARDVMDDARTGRVYLPGEWLREAGIAAAPAAILDRDNRAAVHAVTLKLLDLADRYYASAEMGIARLPLRSACAIAAARAVYRDIGRLIRSRGPAAWDRRASTGKGRKLWLSASGLVTTLASRSDRRDRPRTDLWTRPV